MIIARVTIHDIPAIKELIVDTWHETNGGFLPRPAITRLIANVLD
jgi:hypothetical protein